MNYIKHLTGFFDRVVSDDRLNPTHISLYLSLFQFWNVNRFQNPISICREEIMRVSKIYAKATYHKCMKDLHNFGYVKYIPSYNPFKGSLVHLVIFDPDYEPVQKSARQQYKKQSAVGTAIQTGTEQVLVPYTNNINTLNNKTICGKQAQAENQNLDPGGEMHSDSKTQEENGGNVEGFAQNPAKNRKNQFQNPTLDEVIAFFKSENYPEIEARKFFNHFESNGWKVGGKSPMNNWYAASRNWMLNYQRFTTSGGLPKTQQRTKPEPNNKNYSEPL